MVSQKEMKSPTFNQSCLFFQLILETTLYFFDLEFKFLVFFM